MGKRTPEIEAAVLEGLEVGVPLTQICRAEGFPTPKSVRDWCDADPAFAIAYARAREIGADAIAEEALAIIDQEPEMALTESGARRDAGYVSWQKLRFEGRLKLLAKWFPTRYGDKTLVGSDPENPLPQGFTVNLVKSK